ncbi:hypothetical protein [Streptomyces sp. NPDC051636]|uniref:hypothetical protein n=1 Tax=Streptomyces sp. NPDC051636 TaxID=3365663 RepID=UPI0037BCE3F5
MPSPAPHDDPEWADAVLSDTSTRFSMYAASRGRPRDPVTALMLLDEARHPGV